MLINVPMRSHKKLLAAISAICSFQHAVKQSAISKLTICQRWEDPAQKEPKETEKGNAKMWDTCVWFTWRDYQSFRFRTCWLMFVGVLGIAVASNNPWNKGRMFGLSCDKFLMIILMHGTQWSQNLQITGVTMICTLQFFKHFRQRELYNSLPHPLANYSRPFHASVTMFGSLARIDLLLVEHPGAGQESLCWAKMSSKQVKVVLSSSQAAPVTVLTNKWLPLPGHCPMTPVKTEQAQTAGTGCRQLGLEDLSSESAVVPPHLMSEQAPSNTYPGSVLLAHNTNPAP